MSTEHVVELRRDLHAHPERGWCEFRTSSIVAERLAELGFDVAVGPDVVDPTTEARRPGPEELERAAERAVGEGADPDLVDRMAGGLTGVVGTLEHGDGPTVGFRVDMDALPVEEADDGHLPANEGFQSTHAGEMHACGHDGHTAIGLGLAERVASDEGFDGTLKLFFQPAEEGLGGGRAMASGGHLDDMDALVAVHLGLGIPTGTVVSGVEFLTAGSMEVTFTGRSAHAAAAPEEGASALHAAASATCAIQAIPRHSEGMTRVNVGRLDAGTASNVIPERAVMEVETRGESDALYEYARERATRAIEGAAHTHGVEVEIEQRARAISVPHRPAFAERVAAVVSGTEDVEHVESHRLVSGSEDACFLLRRVREHGGEATYAIVGADLAGPHHAGTFDFDERALGIGVDTLARVARDVAANGVHEERREGESRAGGHTV
ncbi:amidohydrolase [Natronorarus salvus]|uniref:amidohydrolase n=1 Tax=Natronorarus salvus TaxID=3117733 RepID=UPI002F265C31